MNNNKKCPKCKNRLVHIIYSIPDEFFIEEEQKQKEIDQIADALKVV